MNSSFEVWGMLVFLNIFFMSTHFGVLMLCIAHNHMTVESFYVVLLQLSILVHPDKNQDDAERAQQAFES